MRAARLFLILLTFCLLASCRNNPAHNDSRYTPLAQVLKQAQTALKDGDNDKTFGIIESSFFPQLPQQSSDDSIHAMIREAMSTYFSSVKTGKHIARCLHFYNSLVAVIPPHSLLDGYRSDIYANSSFFASRLGDAEYTEAWVDSFFRLPDPLEPIRVMRNCELVAAAVGFTRTHKDRILLLEKGLDVYRATGAPYPYTGRMMSMLASAYRTELRYEDALRVNEEAIAYYQKQGEDAAMSLAYNQLAWTYHLLEFYDKALEANAKAIAIGQRNKGAALGDIYRKRADILNALHRTDSAVYYIRKGREASAAMELKDAVVGSDIFLADVYSEIPDSAYKALPLLYALLPDTAQIAVWIKDDVKAGIGKALYANGKAAAAIPLLEQAAHSYQEAESIEDEIVTYNYLMKAYREVGQKDRFMARYPYYAQLQDSMQKMKNIRSIAMANIRFDTRRKEQENLLLSAEVELKNNRLRFFVTIGLSLLVVGLCAGGWFWMRQKALKLHLRLKEREKEVAEAHLREQSERLQLLITSRQELNNHNEELLRQLAEVQETHENTCHLDQVMLNLQPRLLTKEEEETFRDSFSALYPTVLHRLRTVCPRVTRTDELLCMLIVLKQTNEEIARTLGISRPSVLQNRYRLRTKLSLPEGADLDVEITRMLMKS